ncbi:MAG: hypothetical protein J1E05_08615 [Eubacterium sp.]|nr:hypothetical protein [Eubacterium sp.]
MNYNEALNFIYEKQRLGSVPGLSRIEKLLADMGDPQNDLRIIHIAGTNGKGTVANSIANALIKAGYKVGLFTSPWVIDYREQIQIDGEYISESDFAKYVSEYANAEATEFEFITTIMYKYFSDQAVDYAVVECGMGGEGDATNAVDHSLISVITSVAMDHTDFLGDTLDKIAQQKSGIIKPNSVCVLYPNPECKHIFEAKCNALNSKLINVAEQGNYQKNNIATANAVLSELGIEAKAEIPNIPARQEMMNGIMLDGAHNIDGALALEKNLPNEKICAVIGMMRDKDVDGYLSHIAPHCDMIITVTPDNPRAMNAGELGDLASKYCGNVIVENDISKAIMLLKKQNCFKLICGSFYLARQVRKELLI